ncbi:MAG TPA: helix-hairpin-helix domain-containing protein [Pyrinomonadaceae bacterium]|nr:helix-hairpin-helix domain-containing protein [Pyrinomonadaceae bacterium]
MQKSKRQLRDLISVGPATMLDFRLLGIHSVAQLAEQQPRQLYRELCRLKGEPQDICCLDVFVAAVAQAKDPHLPLEQCQWWFWSKKRKARHVRG